MKGRILWIILIILISFIFGCKIENNCKKRVFFLGKKSLKFGPYDIVVLLLVISLITIAIQTVDLPDIDVYEMSYTGMDVSFEKGFVLVENIFKSLGCTFLMFRAIIISISFILIWLGIAKLDLNFGISCSMFAVFPFVYDVIQLRFFLALSIVIFGLQFIAFKKKYNNIKFIFLVLLASSIHSVCIFYLLLLFANEKIISKRWRQQILLFFLTILLIFSILFKSNGAMQDMIKSIFNSINSEKANAYLTMDMSWGFLFFWLMQISFTISSFLLRKEYKKNGVLLKDNNFALQLFYINAIISCTLPLIIMNSNFYRIYRGFLILNYCQLELFIKLPTSRKKILGMLILIFGVVYTSGYCLSVDPENVVYPFLGL